MTNLKAALATTIALGLATVTPVRASNYDFIATEGVHVSDYSFALSKAYELSVDYIKFYKAAQQSPKP